MGLFTRFIGNSWRLNKAVQLCRAAFSLNVDPWRIHGQATKERNPYIEAIDEYIEKFNPNDHELAVFMLAPIIDEIATIPALRLLVECEILNWIDDGKMRKAHAAPVLEALSEPAAPPVAVL